MSGDLDSGEPEVTASPPTSLALASQLVTLLSPPARGELRLVCGSPQGAALGAISHSGRRELERLLPQLIRFDQVKGHLYIDSAPLRACLLAVLANPETAVIDAVSLIRAAIAAGRMNDALAEFERGGGVFFAYVYGVEPSQLIVNTFPESVRARSEQLILADVINTMKVGNFAHAKYLLTAHFGPTADRLATIAVPGAFPAGAFSHDFACCRLIIAICDEEPIDDDTLSAVFRIMEALPVEAEMQKGMLYNVALDAFFRRRSWATAEETARRAKYHFNNVRATLPAFYIDLYLALLELARGNLATLKVRLAEARTTLANAAQASRNDMALLTVLENICAYEQGEPTPFVEFLATEMDRQFFDEVWPSIARPIIAFGSLAIATVGTLSAARAYIGRWRLQQWQSKRFASTLAQAEIDVLHVHARYHEAEEILTRLTRSNGTDYLRKALPPAGDTLAIEDIGVAMKWCRALLESAPESMLLAQALAGLERNPNLTVRERLTTLVWAAQAAVERQDWDAARAAMGQLITLAESAPIVAVFREQREVLSRIISDRDAVKRLSASAKIAAFVRAQRELADGWMSAVADSGLTRQERRILYLLAEDVPNKLIARRLALSLPTVRFHLRNVYRKLGAVGRDDAIRIAVARGVLTA